MGTAVTVIGTKSGTVNDFFEANRERSVMAENTGSVCGMLSAAPLVTHINMVSESWSRQKKGKLLTVKAAREILCDFSGSPCPLYTTPRRTLAVLSAVTNTSGFKSIGRRLAQHRRLQAAAVRLGWKEDAGKIDLILMSCEGNWRHKLQQSAPLLAFAFCTDDVALGSQVSSESIHADIMTGYSAFVFPRIDGVSSSGMTLLLWDPSRCELPLWDLARPAAHLSQAQMAAATRALGAGLSYAEFFACHTVEPLRPLVRSLFVGSRRNGKSVWSACIQRRSPCLWFTGNHSINAEHERFADMVLASPEVLLWRLSDSWDSARAAGLVPEGVCRLAGT